VFRGIPFAAPPTGARRWAAPQPPVSWTGVLDCAQFPPAPIQQPIASSPLFPLENEPQSEDCLYLNVWSESADARRPVIVWLQPGAFQAGSGSAPFYDGRNWARAGTVLVTLNYRLSRLGFLPLAELSEENADGVSGNYGLLDQIAALEWIRDNIAAFGGDPGCVTLFGVSSGASSASLLMASPAAHGLFHRVIAESGGSFGPVGDRTGIGDRWQTLRSAERSGAAWAASIGAPRVHDLRALSVDRIRSASVVHRNDTAGVFDACRPVIDGKLLIDSTRRVFEAGRQARVPLLVGYAGNESLGTAVVRDLGAYLAQAASEHGQNLEEFLALYPAGTDHEAAASALHANGHRLFTWQSWAWAKLHAAAGNEVYYYRFQKAPPVPESEQPHAGPDYCPGAYHGASIFYSFRRFELRSHWPWQRDDFEVSTTLVEAWAHFARTGRPRASGLADWPVFNVDNPKIMLIGAAPSLGEIPERRYLDFWDRFYLR
jgi:para-nitrobenzyl esterase